MGVIGAFRRWVDVGRRALRLTMPLRKLSILKVVWNAERSGINCPSRCTSVTVRVLGVDTKE